MKWADRKLQIAIDGPAGAGKSTVARAVAEQLGLLYLDTGAMYRVVAYKALLSGISLEDEQEVTRIARKTQISFDHNHKDVVYCDGENVASLIRSQDVSRAVSIVASYPGVREYLVGIQRLEARKGNVVMDGRDIGTCVLPEADLKIFLTASAKERAQRRLLEIKKSGDNIGFEQVLEDIKNRDRCDSEREHAPLKPAPDAIIIDTSGMSFQKVVEKIINLADKLN